MTYKLFKDKYYQEILPNLDIHSRKGQALMNFLGEVWFAEYKRMSSNFAPNVDCFYNDNLIPNALNHLQNNWYKFYEDIKKIYYTISDETEEDDNFTYLTGERNVYAYYVNNDEIVSLFDLNISITDNTEQKIKEELVSLGFSENIRLVTL
jgi:hypothetical protein